MKIEYIMGVVGIATAAYLALTVPKELEATRKAAQSSPIAQSTEPDPARERVRWENAAKDCWKSYDLRSNTPMDKAQIASFCEGLEKRAKEAH